MAENPKFNNSGMFTNVNDSTHNNISVDNKSEVLATQGNVINSIKTFWNNLRAKLKYAVTRTDTTKAVGGNYQPIFVNEDGGVQVCNIDTLTGNVRKSNIDLIDSEEIVSPYSGQIVCITVTETYNTKTNSNLTINNSPVYYPTDVQVKVSDVLDGTYLFTYIKGRGDKWILNNKINVASTNNSGLMTKEQCSKLEGIDDNANYFTYTLPTASASEKGGVKSSSNTDSDNNQKIYHVGVDTNGIMTVNVPWQNTHNTAYLRAGGNNNNNNEATTNGNTYLKIVDGSTTSKIKISGSEGTSVSSDSSGNITIQSSRVTTYQGLKNDNSNNNYNNLTGYLVFGPGQSKANTSNYLAGNGNWVNGILVPIPTEEGKTLKSGSNGTVYWAD